MQSFSFLSPKYFYFIWFLNLWLWRLDQKLVCRQNSDWFLGGWDCSKNLASNRRKNACQSIFIVYLEFCQDDLLKLNEDFVNHRIESHASRINTMEYPTYQEIINMYVQRHLFLHRTLESQWRHLQEAHSGFYCRYKQSLDPGAKCSDALGSRFGDRAMEVCSFEQIEPNFYSK